jgi:hypothetical protein
MHRILSRIPITYTVKSYYGNLRHSKNWNGRSAALGQRGTDCTRLVTEGSKMKTIKPTLFAPMLSHVTETQNFDPSKWVAT